MLEAFKLSINGRHKIFRVDVKSMFNEANSAFQLSFLKIFLEQFKLDIVVHRQELASESLVFLGSL